MGGARGCSHTHPLCVDVFLALEDLDEVGELRQREGVPDDGLVGVVAQHQLAVAVRPAGLQHYHQRTVILKQPPR